MFVLLRVCEGSQLTYVYNVHVCVYVYIREQEP